MFHQQFSPSPLLKQESQSLSCRLWWFFWVERPKSTEFCGHYTNRKGCRTKKSGMRSQTLWHRLWKNPPHRGRVARILWSWSLGMIWMNLSDLLKERNIKQSLDGYFSDLSHSYWGSIHGSFFLLESDREILLGLEFSHFSKNNILWMFYKKTQKIFKILKLALFWLWVFPIDSSLMIDTSILNIGEFFFVCAQNFKKNHQILTKKVNKKVNYQLW